jgi:hypothetical protein
VRFALLVFLLQRLVQATGLHHCIVRVERTHVGLGLGGAQGSGGCVTIEQQAEIGGVAIKRRLTRPGAAARQILRHVKSGAAHQPTSSHGYENCPIP